MTERSGDVAMTIGAVARATDIPANTLRTWERRYGFPTPARTDGNQRLYAASMIPHLRLIAQALAMGHRPRQVLGLDLGQLRALVEPEGAAPPAAPPSGEVVQDWLRAAKDLDGDTLDLGFRAEWARLGPMAFLTQRVAPFLEAIGDLWAAGEVAVFQEHAVSQRLREFLMARWRPLSDRASGSPVVCATLPGELHDLGLSMAATVAALASRRVVYLGADTPVDEIAACVARCRATAVLVSVAVGKEPAVVRSQLSTLREELGPRVRVLVGGAGAVEAPGAQRVLRLDGLAGLLA